VKPLLWSLAPLLLLVSSAQAQESAAGEIRVLVYGVDTVEQCAAPVKALQAEMQTMRFPQGWTLGIVCTPVAWEEILKIADPPRTNRAFSNLIRRSTVLNSAIFRDSRALYRHTLAHELGHAMCDCNDEHKAESYAVKHDRQDRAIAKIDAGAKGLR
jgi:hypothetical protein